MKPNRILMQQEDGAAGSGAPSNAPAPTEPQAQGAAPVVDAAAIAAQVRDSIFAELRRSGALGKEKPAPKSTEPTATAPQPDITQLRALDRAVARSPHATRLSDAAYKRLERAFVEEAPQDASAWLTDYFEGMGLGGAPINPAAPAATTAAAPQPRTAVPISSAGGTPPAPSVPLEERQLLSLSESERAHLIKQKGPRWYMEKFHEQTKGQSIKLR